MKKHHPQLIPGLLLFFFLIFPFAAHSLTVFPQTVNYQGYLTDSSGQAITSSLNITFRLHTTETGASFEWEEVQTVNIVNGLFNIELGSVTPLNVGHFDNPLFLAITVDGESEMSPRKAITLTGYAIKSYEANLLDGASASDLDQSAHVIDFSNPHGVTPAQIGAAKETTLTTHMGNPSAHHTKTSSFTELTDQANDAQLPAAITRDSELAGHAGNASAHHIKTTTFTELTGQASNAQIPSGIARDIEIMPNVLANDGPGSGLNADLLDGQNSSAFMPIATDNWVNTAGDTMSGNLNVLARIGIGTGSPGSPLHIKSTGTSLSNGLRIETSLETAEDWYLFMNPTDDLIFRNDSFDLITFQKNTGNVGFGTASPSDPLSIESGASTIQMKNETEGSTWRLTTLGGGTVAPGGFGISDDGVFRFVVDSTGNTAIGTTTLSATHRLKVAGNTLLTGTAEMTGNTLMTGSSVGIGTSTPTLQLDVFDISSDGPIAKFENDYFGTNADGITIEIGPLSNPGSLNRFIKFQDGDGTQIGWVSGSGAGGVTYNTTSDARLKRNILDFSGGLDTVSRMKVRKYEFIEAPGKEQVGFIAQELQEVVPAAVSGDPQGDVTEEPMGVDYGLLTPILVSAIQELKAENETLKKELSAIKKILNL